MVSASEAFRLTLPPVSVDPNESLLWRSTSGGSSLFGVTYYTLSTLGYWECSVRFSPPRLHGETFDHLDHCRLSDGNCQHSSCHFRCGSRTESCTEVATLKYRNGAGATSTSFSSVESCLGFVSIDKTTFWTARRISDQLLTWKTVFLITFASGKCRGEIHAFEHARLQRTTGWTQVTLRIGLSFISRRKCWARARSACFHALFQHVTVIWAMAWHVAILACRHFGFVTFWFVSIQLSSKWTVRVV